MDCSPPGSSAHGILLARILEWAATSPPGDLPDPGIEPGFPALQAENPFLFPGTIPTAPPFVQFLLYFVAIKYLH